MTVYEEYADLYLQTELYGKLARVEYLPTQQSRKYRNASLVVVLSKDNEHLAQDLKVQNNWYAARWTAVN